jgi:hypothetical protein
MNYVVEVKQCGHKVLMIVCLLYCRGKEKSSGLNGWNHSYVIPGDSNAIRCVSDVWK